jgi:hypothetical protein
MSRQLLDSYAAMSAKIRTAEEELRVDVEEQRADCAAAASILAIGKRMTERRVGALLYAQGHSVADTGASVAIGDEEARAWQEFDGGGSATGCDGAWADVARWTEKGVRRLVAHVPEADGIGGA